MLFQARLKSTTRLKPINQCVFQSEKSKNGGDRPNRIESNASFSQDAKTPSSLVNRSRLAKHLSFRTSITLNNVHFLKMNLINRKRSRMPALAAGLACGFCCNKLGICSVLNLSKRSSQKRWTIW